MNKAAIVAHIRKTPLVERLKMCQARMREMSVGRRAADTSDVTRGEDFFVELTLQDAIDILGGITE